MVDDLANHDYRLAFYDTFINCGLRGGLSIAHILKVLIILYNNYKDDYTKESLEEDILTHQSVLLEMGGYKQKRNIQQEVENLIDFRGSGTTSIADCYADLKLDTKEDKAACRMALNRLVARGRIEKVDSGKTGVYRLVKAAAEKTRFVKGPREHFPVTLPFGLNKFCYIHPKSIIVVAGSKSSGKTATLLNIALENQNKTPVVYLNSDMGDEEYTDRLTKFGCVCEDDVRFEAYNRSKDFHDLITPEKKIFIIDFLEIHENFYEIGKPIKQIWEKLRDGIAIIAIQKKPGADTARGGEFTKEKARLYLSMDFLPSELCTQVTIVDAKAPTPMYADAGVTGWSRKVKIINGSKFDYLNNWQNYGTEKKKIIRHGF